MASGLWHHESRSDYLGRSGTLRCQQAGLDAKQIESRPTAALWLLHAHSALSSERVLLSDLDRASCYLRDLSGPLS